MEMAQDVARKLIESYIGHTEGTGQAGFFRYLHAQTLRDRGRVPLKRFSRIDSMQLIIAGILIDSIVSAFQ